MTSPLYTSREAASYLRMDRDHSFRTIERYARTGKIHHRKIGKSYLFTMDDLNRFIEMVKR